AVRSQSPWELRGVGGWVVTETQGESLVLQGGEDVKVAGKPSQSPSFHYPTNLAKTEKTAKLL
ncbi:MAG: hypothetical protein V5A49_10410, partial [Haloarcula sp.]